MPYLIADDLPTEPAGIRFRRLVERGGIAQLPGAHNGMAALQAKRAGFEGLYLSGAAMTASMGIPDLGMITVDEVCFFVRQVARASGLPVLVDGDTGYGEALNVMHMVRSFEDAGAGAVHIEDQLLPKKCGHLNDKKLADAHDMAAKVAAARKARRHLYIIARTDAAASEGMDGAVARAKMYLDAGADAILIHSKHPDLSELEEVARSWDRPVPLVAVPTTYVGTPLAELALAGFRLVIYANQSLRAAVVAMRQALGDLRAGRTLEVEERIAPLQEIYRLVGLGDLQANEAESART